MKPIDTLFFTNFRGSIGLVIGENELTGERRGYISICSGQDEETDIKMVLDHGSRISPATLVRILESLKGKSGMVVYAGRRHNPAQGTVSDIMVERDGQPFSPGPSQVVINHSPDGFNWGYAGSGPAQLALALLLDVLGNPEQAIRNHNDFKDDFVSGWRDDWSISSDDILKWFKDKSKGIK